MHDIMAAKDIFDLILRYAHRNKFKVVRKVEIELGLVAGEDHVEDILPSNLKANLKLLAKGSPAEKAEFHIIKTNGRGYRLMSIEGDK
ncbi:MAG: hypothetical protein WC528_03090 [Patescibacteria group bacterium]